MWQDGPPPTLFLQMLLPYNVRVTILIHSARSDCKPSRRIAHEAFHVDA